ncbi:MAG: DUF975 family protein [Peptococcales bacterium]
MEKTNSELKIQAKKNLEGNWGLAIIACVIVWLLTAAFTGNGARDTSQAESFMSLIGFFLTGPLTFGLATIYLKFVRSQNTEFKDLFGGFSYFTNTLLLHFITTIFIILWSLLLIIPGIIAFFRYSMAYYIMVDNPELTALEAIRQSKEMMRGQKGRLFLLWLSFIGWFFLGLITMGIGFLYLLPYYQATKANFYEELKDSYFPDLPYI